MLFYVKKSFLTYYYYYYYYYCGKFDWDFCGICQDSTHFFV